MNRADASRSGLHRGTFDDVIRRSGADDIAQFEYGLGIQQLEVIGRPLFPPGMTSMFRSENFAGSRSFPGRMTRSTTRSFPLLSIAR